MLVSETSAAFAATAPERHCRSMACSSSFEGPIHGITMVAGSLERGHHLFREEFHRAQHPPMLQIAEPEATIEMADPHQLLHPFDLTDTGVGRANDEEARQEVVGLGFLVARHSDGAATFDALVAMAQTQRYPHIPARL